MRRPVGDRKPCCSRSIREASLEDLLGLAYRNELIERFQIRGEVVTIGVGAAPAKMRRRRARAFIVGIVTAYADARVVSDKEIAELTERRS